MTDKPTTRQGDSAAQSSDASTPKNEEKNELKASKDSENRDQLDHPRATDVDYEAVKVGVYANLDAAVAGRESMEPGKSPGGTKAFDHDPPQLVGPQTREGHRPEIRAAIEERNRRAGIN